MCRGLGRCRMGGFNLLLFGSGSLSPCDVGDVLMPVLQMKKWGAARGSHPWSHRVVGWQKPSVTGRGASPKQTWSTQFPGGEGLRDLGSQRMNRRYWPASPCRAKRARARGHDEFGVTAWWKESIWQSPGLCVQLLTACPGQGFPLLLSLSLPHS